MATGEQVREAIAIWQAHKDVPGKTTTVGKQLCCDMCTHPALVNGKTANGPLANMCLRHYHTHGIGLGTGKGQVLIWRKSSHDHTNP